MRKHPKRKPVFEKAACEICGAEFERLARGCRSKRFCDGLKCRRILRLGHDKPVGFKGIAHRCSTTYADSKYYGGYHE